MRPASQEDFPQSAWYNIFALHQNRMAHAGSNKDFMKESFLPRFLDFVVWGHEHECISEPWVSPAAQRSVMNATLAHCSLLNLRGSRAAIRT